MSYRNQDLRRTVSSLDGKSYGAYKSLKGSYDMGNFTLSIDRIQSDPYAPPSLMRIILDRKTAGIPPELLDDAQGRLAVSDFLIAGVSCRHAGVLDKHWLAGTGHP